MLSSAEFNCLRVAYREAFWEELTRLIYNTIWKGCSIRRPLLFWVHEIFFHSLPSRVACSFQGKMFTILNCFASFLLNIIFLPAHCPREPCTLCYCKVRSSWENVFAYTRFVLLTQAINLSGFSWLRGRTEYPLSQALTLFTQTSVSYWTLLLLRK